MPSYPKSSNSSSPGSQPDPYDRPRSDPRSGEQISPPTLLTESSVTLTIEFNKLVGEWEVEICNLMVATTTGTGGNENHKGEYFEQNKIK